MEKIDKATKADIETAKMLEDAELEKGIVAYLMSAPYEHIQEVRGLIKTQYFYHDVPRHVYQLICLINDRGDNVTPMLLMPEVMKRGKIKMADFTELMSYQTTFLNYIDLLKHVDVLTDYAKRRDLWLQGQKLIKEGTCVGADLDKVAEEVKHGIDDIVYDSVQGGSKSMQELLLEIQNIVDENTQGKKADMCMPTGFSFIDNQDGLSKGDLDIIAATSSMGKTAMAVSLAINVITEGYDIAFFSTEMKPIQISARILSHYTQLYSSTILKKQMTEEQVVKFNDGMTKVYEASSHLFFHEKNTSNYNEIVQSIKKLHSQHRIKGVVIDFIQRLSGRDKGENDNSFYARVSQKFKDLALELDIWIVLLSQLNRNNDSSKDAKDDTKYIPTPDRLRGSGEIFEAADNVWFIYRPDYYNKEYGKSIKYPSPYENVKTEGTAMIIVAKGRNVGTGSFIVGFDANTTHFYELSKVPTICPTAEQVKNELSPATKVAMGGTNNNTEDNALPF